MTKTIQQNVAFESTTPEDLFNAYLDSKKHSELTGAPAQIDSVVGGKFSAFDGGLSGRILQLVPTRLIVQSWRGQPWKDEDLDSTLILRFESTSSGAAIHLVHANIPDHAAAMVNEHAWNERYWSRWNRQLRKAGVAGP